MVNSDFGLVFQFLVGIEFGISFLFSDTEIELEFWFGFGLCYPGLGWFLVLSKFQFGYQIKSRVVKLSQKGIFK